MTPELEKIIKLLKKATASNSTIEELTLRISGISTTSTFKADSIGNLSGITIEVDDKKLFYFENASKRYSLTNFQKTLNLKFCPPPFYLVGEGVFFEKVHAIHSQGEFNELIYSIFSPQVMATIYNQLILPSPILSTHRSTIFEAIEAYCLGMDYISTDSLISVLEGSLREVIHLSGEQKPSHKFQKYIRGLALGRLKDKFEMLNEFYWYPFKCSSFQHAIENKGTEEELNLWVQLDHTMDSVNAFLAWFSDVLYKEYTESETEFTLNRHNFMHAFTQRKAAPVYFPLMLWSLLSIKYIESLFVNGGSLFFPDATESDKKLGDYFESLFKGPAAMRRSIAKQNGVAYERT